MSAPVIYFITRRVSNSIESEPRKRGILISILCILIAYRRIKKIYPSNFGVNIVKFNNMTGTVSSKTFTLMNW